MLLLTPRGQQGEKINPWCGILLFHVGYYCLVYGSGGQHYCQTVGKTAVAPSHPQTPGYLILQKGQSMRPHYHFLKRTQSRLLWGCVICTSHLGISLLGRVAEFGQRLLPFYPVRVTKKIRVKNPHINLPGPLLPSCWSQSKLEPNG